MFQSWKKCCWIMYKCQWPGVILYILLYEGKSVLQSQLTLPEKNRPTPSVLKRRKSCLGTETTTQEFGGVTENPHGKLCCPQPWWWNILSTPIRIFRFSSFSGFAQNKGTQVSAMQAPQEAIPSQDLSPLLPSDPVSCLVTTLSDIAVDLPAMASVGGCFGKCTK